MRKILAKSVLQYLKRQQLMPPKAAYNAAQTLFVGPENIFLHWWIKENNEYKIKWTYEVLFLRTNSIL